MCRALNCQPGELLEYAPLGASSSFVLTKLRCSPMSPGSCRVNLKLR
ncbi:helix-turn-helix domain-containing protein [Nostoc sp.]